MDSYNFGPATENEDIVHGAQRPGYYANSPDKEAVVGWIDFMKSKEIEGVCSLLSPSDLGKYAELLDRYREAFGDNWVCHVPVSDRTGIEKSAFHEEVVPFLRRADRENTPVVVHCSAGLGRTGHVLALWLAYARDYALDEAIEAVANMGRSPLEAVTTDYLEEVLEE